MKQLNVKKLVLLNLPYFLLGLFATNLGEAWRLATGADASAKMLSFFSTLPVALGSWWPSLHPLDLLVGLLCLSASPFQYGLCLYGNCLFERLFSQCTRLLYFEISGVNSIISPMSHCSAVQIFTSTSVVTFSFLPNFAIDAWLIPAAAHKSFFFISLSINNFHNFL